MLLAKIIKGGIEDQENLEISCEEVFLMDFGEASFTSFEAGEDWITFFDRFPQVDPTKRTEENKQWFIGKIHSHHNMSAFHSGVDTTDLYENAPKLPFFLSLVVNYNCTPFAEIAVAGEIEQKSVVRNRWSLKNFNFNRSNKIDKKDEKKAFTYIIPCDTLYYTEQWIIDQIEVVRQRNRKTIVTTGFDCYNQHKNSETKDKEKVGANMGNPKGYKLILSYLSELLVLGVGTKATFATPPGTVYDYVDYTLNASSVESYVKAFRQYFINEWFDDYFTNTNITEVDVIAGLRYFIQQHPISNKWLNSFFKPALDELEKEIKLLREIQGSILV